MVSRQLHAFEVLPLPTLAERESRQPRWVYRGLLRLEFHVAFSHTDPHVRFVTHLQLQYFDEIRLEIQKQYRHKA